MPVVDGMPDTEAAEQWLGGHGYERGEAETVLVRDGAMVGAAAAMRIEDGIAVLGLDATVEAERGRGCNRALLRRRLLDAAAARCHTVVAQVGEGGVHAGLRRNLLAAGFAEAYAVRDWQRPALRPALSA